ncbi:hypothetical protein F3Y22_tig00014444pilonHSYRG00051 [Hibiscus syriacus]|uniref:Uncharacterized protein n=1 Tax=Hibiscus syriacus TaxID=106335 RepID=A0A6A3BZ70_HIBSY|nr:hypothetical protein F3Y22_tig00014444pilonHSYRG00051 [Hibiscus syriacus]
MLRYGTSPSIESYLSKGAFKSLASDYVKLFAFFLWQVWFAGNHAYTVLRHFCFDLKDQALPVVEMVPPVVLAFKMNNVETPMDSAEVAQQIQAIGKHMFCHQILH